MRLAPYFPWLALGGLGCFGACSSTPEPAQPGQPQAGASSGAAPAPGGQASGSGGSIAVAGGSGGSVSGSGGGGGVGAAAGSGGSSGDSNGAGSAGQSTQGEAAQPSAGCNLQTTIEPGTFASGTVGGRQTWIHLPPSYDPARSYPLIFVWKGCSTAGVSTFGLQNVVAEDAILAQIDFAPGEDCYDTADGATFIDLPVFDALLQEVETKYCIDKAHVFSVGFSSGAWMTQLLACQRGDLLRGIGTIAGAFKPAFTNGAPACVGSGMSAFMVSDLDDHNNPFYDEDSDGDSVEVAVNHWLVQNGCSEATWSLQAGTPSEPDASVCKAYAGCGKNPVKLCLTSGKGHSPQEALSMPGFWAMFREALPAK